jgi:putative flippase GtrA
VSFDRFLPARFAKLAPEAVKFALVGGLNTGVNFLIFWVLILTVLSGSQLKANVIATVVATVTSYLMNRHWTYRSRPKTAAVHREFMLFLVFNAAGLAIELAVIGVTKYWFGLTGIIAVTAAKVVGTALGTIFRFVTYRTFVFSPAAQPVGAGADIDFGPAHLHVDNTAELIDAEALASALAGVPMQAHIHPQPHPQPQPVTR